MFSKDTKVTLMGIFSKTTMLLLCIIWDPFTAQNLLEKKKKVNVLGDINIKSRGQKTSGMARSRHSKMLTQVHVDNTE